MADVADDLGGHDGVVETVIDSGSKVIMNWHRWIAGIIAKNFRCRVFYRSSPDVYGRKLMVFGLKEDTEVCTEVLNFALQSAHNCWTSFKADRDRRHGRPASRKINQAIKNDYMVAFARGVKAAFERQVLQKEIVLAQSPKLDTYADTVLKLRTENRHRRTTVRDAYATRRGFQDGRQIRGGERMTQPANLLSR
jgi:hypothetical protein